MRGRSSGEEGMALLVVMVLMGIMLTTGFALVSTVDTQTSASQAERVRDSAFNLAESALNAQVFALAREWPGLGLRPGGTALPYDTCTQASTSTRCPTHAALIQGGSPDLTAATWETKVRDNGAGSAPNFYSDASTALQPGYDANNDGSVWVRAQAVAQGRARTLVALVHTERQEEDLPRAALIAGSLRIVPNGNPEVIQGNSGLVAVRCDAENPLSPNYLQTCLGHPLTGANGSLGQLLANLATQITGSTPVQNYTNGGQPAMTVEARERLKATAIANGTYYASCPTAAQLNGQVVYVESANNCVYTGNTQFNSAQAPGVLIVNSGSVTFGGTTTFHGVVYSANTTAVPEAVQTTGNARIIGGVIIDGSAQMVIGSSGLHIQYDINAFRAVASYGSAGVVQNTWREIRAG